MSGSVSFVCAPSQLAPTIHVTALLDFDNDVLLSLVEKQSNLQRLSPAELRETVNFSVQVNLKLWDEVSRLNILLKKQSGKLEKLEKMVDVLATKSEENERRIELERNKRKQQQVIMQEIFIKTQLKTGVPLSRLSVLPGTKAGEVSKEFWVLRSHQNNLISTTRSFIYQIIRATAAAGVVSKKVGKCAVNCTIPDHDCTASFYEALLVRVGESPTTLQDFLQLMKREFMQPIFAQMLKDVG